MNVVIIGNPRKSGDKIKDIAAQFIEAGVNVRYPTMDDLATSEELPIIETFERIDWSNFIIAMPNDGLNIEYSIMAQLAYAKHVKKPVLVYYE